MTPISRGTPPIEYALRVPCRLGSQFGFREPPHLREFRFLGKSCTASFADGEVVIAVKGIADLVAARSFYAQLQTALAHLSLLDRHAISVPIELQEPGDAHFLLLDGDERCVQHGWPAHAIKPKVVHAVVASVYPEHEYVVLDSAFVVVPTILGSAYDLVSGLEHDGAQPFAATVDRDLMLAIAIYVDAVRSTSWVSSFLSIVSVLEMLATQKSSSAETCEAVDKLTACAKAEFKVDGAVDLERILAALGSAKRVSITAAVRTLVLDFCGPDSSLSPKPSMFQSVDECNRKVSAIYAVRSAYSHKGAVPVGLAQKYSFGKLSGLAFAVARHILLCRMEGLRSAATT